MLHTSSFQHFSRYVLPATFFVSVLQTTAMVKRCYSANRLSEMHGMLWVRMAVTGSVQQVGPCPQKSRI